MWKGTEGVHRWWWGGIHHSYQLNRFGPIIPASLNPYRVASIMKRHFPRVRYYFCSQLGTLSVSE